MVLDVIVFVLIVFGSLLVIWAGVAAADALDSFFPIIVSIALLLTCFYVGIRLSTNDCEYGGGSSCQGE